MSTATTCRIEAKNTQGQWEMVCTDPIPAAAQAIASYIARRYEVETRVVEAKA